MRLTLMAECQCKVGHTIHSIDDIYPICDGCTEELEWYDPFEDKDELEKRDRREARRSLKKSDD